MLRKTAKQHSHKHDDEASRDAEHCAPGPARIEYGTIGIGGVVIDLDVLRPLESRNDSACVLRTITKHPLAAKRDSIPNVRALTVTY